MRSFWTLLLAIGHLFTQIGPAPKGEGEEGGDDAAGDEGDGADEGAEPGFFDPDPDDPDEDEADGGEPEGGDDDDDDEDEEEDGDEDEEGEEDEGDDGDDEEDEDEEDEDSVRAELLDTKWEAELAAKAGRGEGKEPKPTLALDKMGLRDQARARFAAIRDKDDDGEKDPEAIFEIALDAAVQVIASYHYDHAGPQSEHMTKGIRNAQVSARLGTFTKEMGEALTPKIERKMAAIYSAKAEKHGWRNADSIPFEDLYAMAGGKPVKGKKSKKSAASKAKRKAARQKAKDLGATHTPRRVAGGRPSKGKKLTAEDREEKAISKSLQRSEDSFFNLGI